MRKISISLAAVLCSATSFAKVHHGFPPPPNFIGSEAQGRALANNSSVSQNKGAGISSRLIAINDAYGDWAGNYRNSDSTTYTYSSTRGGDLTTQQLYDVETDYYWDTVANGYIPAYRFSLTYTSANKFQTYLQQSWNGSSWDDQYRGTEYFDATGRDTASKDEMFSNGAWTIDGYARSTYNSSNQVTSQTNLNWTGSAYVNSSRILFTYDAAGHILTQVSQAWSNGAWINDNSSYTYTYNAAGKVSTYIFQYFTAPSATPTSGSRTTNYYNGAGQISSVINEYLNNGMWNYSDSTANLAFNTAGSPLTYNTYAWGGNWTLISRYTDTYTASNKISTDLREDMNGTTWTPGLRTFSTYNSYDQLSHYYTQSWNGTAWTALENNDVNTHYYYQNYNDGLGIFAGTIQPENKLQLWPVPAQSTLNVQFSTDYLQSYNAIIMDMSGKVVSMFSGTTSGKMQRSVDVTALPAGNYILKLDADGISSKRQFSVQH